MNFYRRSAPRKSSTIHTYISNALESEIPIRRAKSPIEHLRIRPIYVPFATFGAMLRCVGVDIRTARLHDFLPADLVVFSIESLGSGAPLQLLKSAYGDRQAPASGPRLFVLPANRIPPLPSQFSFVRTGNLETQDSLACPFQMSVMSFYTAA